MATNSPIKVTQSLETQIQAATSVQEIQALLHAAARDQHLIEPHSWDSTGSDYYGMRAVEPPIPQGLAKTLVINGVKHIVEGRDDAELQANELALMRKLFDGATSTTEQARDEAGQFVTQEAFDAEAARIAADPAADAEAAIVERALKNRGISMETLRQLEGQKITKTWQEAAEEFKQGAGADWAGGENLAIMQSLLQSTPELMDKPSVETLTAVWQYMKENNLVVENTELAAERARMDAINGATDYESLKAAVGYHPESSSQWGR